MKRIIVYIAIALFVAVVYFFLRTPSTVSGTVVKHSVVANQWGIQPKGILFYHKIVFVDELPTSLQKEGLVVECKYKDNIRDVIGMGDWGVVINGTSCTTEEDNSGMVTTKSELKTYTNKTLGFSISIPKKVYSEYVCPGVGYSDLVVVENYDSVSFGINCNGVVKLPGNAWTIRVYDSVMDNDTISSIFKKTYGDTCEIDPKFVSDGNGNFDITYLSDGKEPDQTNCWINYASYFKYNPALQKIVTWSIGQESNFWKGDQTWISDTESPGYDEEMSKSFRFITE